LTSRCNGLRRRRPGYYFGWKDGSVTADNPGVANYSTAARPCCGSGSGHGAAHTLATGASFARSARWRAPTRSRPPWSPGRCSSSTSRASSAGWATRRSRQRPARARCARRRRALVRAGAGLEPHAVGRAAVLRRHRRPARRGALGERRHVARTHLVKDLKPRRGQLQSDEPRHVGGVLYFTANAAAAARSCGRATAPPTANGPRSCDIPGVPAQFTAARGPRGSPHFTGGVERPAGQRPDVHAGCAEERRHRAPAPAEPRALGDRRQRDARRPARRHRRRAVERARRRGTAIDHITVTSDGTHLAFAADPASGIAQLSLEGATALGFTQAQASAHRVSLAAASPAPLDGQLGSDLAFSLELHAARRSHGHAQPHADAAGHRGQRQRRGPGRRPVGLLSAALNGAGSRPTRSPCRSTAAPSKLTANEVSLLGIVAHGAGRSASTPTRPRRPPSGLHRTAATTPANGHVAIDLHFSLDVVYGDGQVKTRAVTLTDAQIGNNATLSASLADLSAALTGSGIQAAAESGHLVFQRRRYAGRADHPPRRQRARLRRPTRFRAAGRPPVFVTDRGALGSQLWMSDGSTAQMLLGLVSARTSRRRTSPW